jgi:uncharacterized protein with GYD domain
MAMANNNPLNLFYFFGLAEKLILLLLNNPIEVICLIFVSLGKFRRKPSAETSAATNKMLEDMKKMGIKVTGFYWTLGRYDTVLIFEAPNEKEAMKLAINASELVATETMVAIPREEATTFSK